MQSTSWETLGYANGFPWWLSGKESACQCRSCGFDPWIWKILWRRKWQPAPVFLPGKSHGQRSLAGWDPPFFVVFMCLPDVHGCCPGHGVLQFGGLQRVGHDLVTKQQQRCWWHLIPAPCVLQVVGTVMAGFAMSFTLTCCTSSAWPWTLRAGAENRNKVVWKPRAAAS